MAWIPTLADRSGPAYRQIVEAIESDIAGGRLHHGEQLPTHRALAAVLGLDLTTVTRAYTEARRRGLTEARVGQGTFVAGRGGARIDAAARAEHDLTMNLPPQPAEADLEGRIVRGLAALQREGRLGGVLSYRNAGGSAEERSAAAAWLRPRLPHAAAELTVISPGTQAALHAWLLMTLQPGDVLLTETLTYPGIKAAAAAGGVRLIGVASDRDGLLPDALEEACTAHRPKALYVVPTIANPTTITWPQRRRESIAAIVRARGLALLEDDAYGALEPEAEPLAALVPERTWLAATLSKCIAPGLRLSIVMAPDRDAATRLAGMLRATVQMPVPMMVALVTRWLRDGSAADMIAAIRAEAMARQALAARILAGLPFDAHRRGHHIWVPLPERWGRAEFAGHVQRQGLAVVTSEAFAVGDAPPLAVRVALGAAASRAELAAALELLAGALRSAPLAHRVV